MTYVRSMIFGVLALLGIASAQAQTTTLNQLPAYSNPTIASGDLFYCAQGQKAVKCTLNQILSSLGSFTPSAGSITPNFVYAGPGSGSASPPTFRPLVGADIPVPGASSRGGVFSSNAGTNKVAVGVDTSGNVLYDYPLPTLTLRGVVLGGGAGGAPTSTAAGTNGQIVVGVTGSAPAFQTMSGDGTLSSAGALTISGINGVSFPASPGVGAVPYVSGTNTISYPTTLTFSGSALTVGAAGSTTGSLKLGGATSGTAILTSQTTAGSPTLTIGTTSGTIAGSATSPLAIDATTGVVSCPTCITSANPNPPGGRLTLTSATPVMTADVTAGTSLFYATFRGNAVPVYSGSAWSQLTIGSDNITMALDSNAGHTGYQQSGKNFDVFGYSASGTLTLCTGPAWTSDTARSTAVALKDGIWTNNAAMTCRFGSVVGNTLTVSQFQGTLLGTMRATADGTTAMVFRPAATAGGNANFLAVSNAYNTVPVMATSRDSSTGWAYATNTWRVANAGGTGSGLNNRVSWIDTLGQARVKCTYQTYATAAATSGQPQTGCNFDSTSATPTIFGQNFDAGVASAGATMTTSDHTISLGFHFGQAMENSVSGNNTFGGQGMQLSVEMVM